MRARAVLAMARRVDDDLPMVADELLVDPAWPVRQAAAEAIGIFGQRGVASALIVVLAGKPVKEEEPQVITSCMQSLLQLAPEWALSRLRDAVFGPDEDRFECALLALSQSARDDALTTVLEYLEDEPHVARRDRAIRAIGLHRTERALAALLDFIASGSLATARAAVHALVARRFDMGVRARALEAVHANGAAPIATAFEEVFQDVAGAPVTARADGARRR